MPSRNFFTVLSDDLDRARDFYVGLLGYEVVFESDWFVQLRGDDDKVELALMPRTHDLVPDRIRGRAAGGLLTVVVDDVDDVHRRALQGGVEVLEPPTNQFYGQRRTLVVDPDGVVLDVSSPCEPDPAWLASVSG